MAIGRTRNPGRQEPPEDSPYTHLVGVTFPKYREELARIAASASAPPHVINLFAALPKAKYESIEEVQRDFGEAARRSGLSNMRFDEQNDRRNIGRDAFADAHE